MFVKHVRNFKLSSLLGRMYTILFSTNAWIKRWIKDNKDDENLNRVYDYLKAHIPTLPCDQSYASAYNTCRKQGTLFPKETKMLIKEILLLFSHFVLQLIVLNINEYIVWGHRLIFNVSKESAVSLMVCTLQCSFFLLIPTLSWTRLYFSTNCAPPCRKSFQEADCFYSAA